MQNEVSATARKVQGKGASRRMRYAGKVPGILYGANQPAQPIELDQNALYHQLQHRAFRSSILTMKLDGKTEQVLLRDLQMHPFKQLVLHVDFQRVAKDQKIRMKVPLRFVNAEICPGIKLYGGIANHIFSEIDVSCLPADLPEFIEVDLGNLGIGQSIRLSQLTWPKGVEAVALGRGDDLVVASITVMREEVIEEVVAPAIVGEEGAVPPEGAPAAEGAAAPEGEPKEGDKKEAARKEGEKKEPEKKEAGKKEMGKKEAGKKEGDKK